MKAREKKTDMQSSGTINNETLLKLTKNLSLTPSRRHGFR